MLHEDMNNLGGDGVDEAGHSEELDLLEQLNKLAIEEDKYVPEAAEVTEERSGLKEAMKGWLNPNDKIFSKQQISSKVRFLFSRIFVRLIIRQYILTFKLS